MKPFFKRNLVVYSVNILYYICFGFLLCFFHLGQWLALHLFGFQYHKKSVDWLNFFLLGCLKLLGTNIRFQIEEPLPKHKSLIVVANHQSTYDIPPLIWYLRKHHLKFVSKKELGKGIPSISFNLRHGGSVLIDRKDKEKALTQIKDFACRIAQEKWGVIIFPEGTRSKDGKPKPFQRGGLSVLISSMPEAYIIPVSIKNSWQLAQRNYFPMPLATKLLFKIHRPIVIGKENPNDLINKVERIIKTELATAI